MSTTLPIVTEATLDAELASGVVALEFSAVWCTACRMLAPVIESVARDYAAELRVLQIDADENPRTAARYGVRGLPTTLLFRDGQFVDRVVGAVPRATFAARVEHVLGR